MNLASKFRNSLETIEESYEFLLTYGAQGRKHETNDQGSSKIRESLKLFNTSLSDIQKIDLTLFEENISDFNQSFLSDLSVVKSIINTILDKEIITSDMIDHTNGLIVMRSLMTSLFFIDQVILPKR
jgi:hypothetical protein